MSTSSDGNRYTTNASYNTLLCTCIDLECKKFVTIYDVHTNLFDTEKVSDSYAINLDKETNKEKTEEKRNQNFKRTEI